LNDSKIVIESSESTVIAEYIPQHNKSRHRQTEAELEAEFINTLCDQAYEYVDIKSEADLIINLRDKISKLNNVSLSDNEWERLFTNGIACRGEGITEKTRRIQTDHVQVLQMDDGRFENISLIDKYNIHNNSVQVINQYKENRGVKATRYDVTILINGLPMVHIELKSRGGNSIRGAFNQINRYQQDSFWASNGLFEYVQIFVISNGTNTKYFSNTTRSEYLKDKAVGGEKRSKKTNNSFEFTSYWADLNNRVIPDLIDFTKTFFYKHTLLNIITKFCVFTSNNTLMVMRPYQIAATEGILSRIKTATMNKRLGSREAGGYVWHTTGSGKTLTSFKTAQLASSMPNVDKVLFVVDRKDLDYQTMREYDKFEKGAANSNKSTKVLQSQIESDSCRIIVTTIQKLDVFISKNKAHPIYNKNIVIIFDECHRSQFGEMHSEIIKSFKKYILFGFTGTPIFNSNSSDSKDKMLIKTTEQVFGSRIHIYTVVSAIQDENVLPFLVDYIGGKRKPKDKKDKEVIDTLSITRIREIVKYILDNFDTKTYRNSNYDLNNQRVSGFNSMVVTESIEAAMKYYTEFKKQLLNNNRPLKVAVIFCHSTKEMEGSDLFPEEDFDIDNIDKTSREFLDKAIADYNKTFNTNFDTSSEKFQNYYKDVSKNMKNRELDILIVVNMFITGFDAPTLNTIWIDRELRLHGLMQTFSRTNRILNTIKTHGNIVCFRDLREEVDRSIILFGDENAKNLVIIRPFADYYYGYKDGETVYPGYIALVTRLKTKFPLENPIVGEQNKKNFVELTNGVLRLTNRLSSFREFRDKVLLTERESQDYRSRLLDIYQETKQKREKGETTSLTGVDFELEILKQIEVNVDYIVALISKHSKAGGNEEDVTNSIKGVMMSSQTLRSKAGVIIEVIKDNFTEIKDSITEGEVGDILIRELRKSKDLEIQNIIKDEQLKDKDASRLINRVIREGHVDEQGVELDYILPPTSRFEEDREDKKGRVLGKIKVLVERYADVI